MSILDHSQWNILGYFQYQDQTISLKSSPDEKDYILLTKVRTEYKQPIHFNTLSEAKEAFTREVTLIIHFTSTSDLSVYMQQRARSVIYKL